MRPICAVLVHELAEVLKLFLHGLIVAVRSDRNKPKCVRATNGSGILGSAIDTVKNVRSCERVVEDDVL